MQKSKQNHKQQIQTLENALKTEKLSKNEYIRIQAVLLRKRGYSHQEIMEITGKSKDAIKDWITKFNQIGLDGLKDQPITKPRNYKLTKGQKDKIKDILHNKQPQDFGFSGDFWDINNLKQLIKQEFNVVYQSPTSYQDLFEFCGFSYQKVKFQDSRRDEAKIEGEQLRLEKKLKKGILRMYW